MNSRREIVRMLGLSPMVGPAALKQLGGMVSGPLAQQSAAVMSATIASGIPPPGPPGMSILGKVLFGDIERLKRQAENERYRERRIDYDIAALRSTSPAYKALKQAERDRELDNILYLANQMLWGNP